MSRAAKTSPMDSESAAPSRRWPSIGVWFPAVSIAFAGAATAAAVALVDNSQGLMLMVVGVILIAALLEVLAWLLVFSGYAWRRRVAGLLIIVAVLGAVGASLRIEGLSGDLIPRLSWRWIPPKNAALDLESPVAPRTESRGVIDLEMTTAHDYAQFLGADRTSRVEAVTLGRDWSSAPKTRWRHPVGKGWSSFAIVGRYALTQEKRGSQEATVCYELDSGRTVWTHPQKGTFESRVAGDGPRATPTVAEGRVYVMSSLGRLDCLAGENGSLIWSRDVVKENGGQLLMWGHACSPLVVGRLVVASGGAPDGRLLAAYDKETGQPAWTSGHDHASYSSPTFATLCGMPQIMIVSASRVAAHGVEDGKELWAVPWPKEPIDNPNVSQPVSLDEDRVFLSSGYGVGCAVLQLTRGNEGIFSVATVWENRHLKTKFTNVVVRNGFVFGLDEGVLTCVNLADGRRRWKAGRYGHGQVLLVGELIIVQAESGEVALVEATPARHSELGRFQALDDKTWNNPAFSAPYLLVRNDQEAACYELPLAELAVPKGHAAR